jgi:hypothetical protein
VTWSVKRPWRMWGVLAVLWMPPLAAAPASPPRQVSGAGVLDTAIAACSGPATEVCSPGGWCWKDPSAPNDSFQDAWAVDEQTVLVVGPPDRVLHWRGDRGCYLPSGTSSALNSIWAWSPLEAWAVGEAGTIVHWDGARWTQVRTGGPPLHIVFGTGPQDVWAGGAEGTLLHWDGARWRDVPSGTTQVLYALWASGPSDVWVSAFQGSQGAVRHWNGLNWSTLPATEGLVTGLWGLGPGDVWVVGSRGLFAHWTGRGWQDVLATRRTGSMRRIRGFGAHSRQLWVVGPSVWRHEGDRLRVQEYDYSRADSLLSVAGFEGQPLLAVGADGSLVRYREGEQWEVLSARPDTVRLTFGDVWASAPTDAWAVRDEGTLFHWDGARWSPTPGMPLMVMSRVSGSSASDVWVAGRMNGTYEAALVHFNGRDWRELRFDEAETFVDVWALRQDAAWALSRTGTVRRWDGVAWHVVANVNRALNALHGSRADDVWAVGDGGTLFQWNGQRWVDRSVVGPDFKAVWVFAPDDVWASGLDASLWHWDGREMRRVDSGASGDVRAFFGGSAGDLWAVGEQGASLHWNGQVWESVSSGTRRNLRGLWGAGGRLFAVGTGATILQRD